MKHYRIVDHDNHILEKLRDVGDECGIEVHSSRLNLAYENNWDAVRVSFISLDKQDKRNQDVASFLLQQMPGCCAILTMSYIQTREPEFHFEDAVEYVEEAAKRAAFGSIVLTQVLYDPCIEKNHWYSLVKNRDFLVSQPFINAKSGNKVVYLTKDLGQIGKMEGYEGRIWPLEKSL